MEFFFSLQSYNTHRAGIGIPSFWYVTKRKRPLKIKYQYSISEGNGIHLYLTSIYLKSNRAL